MLKLSAEASYKRYKLQEIEDIEKEIIDIENEMSSNGTKMKSLEALIKRDIQNLTVLLKELTGKNLVIAE